MNDQAVEVSQDEIFLNHLKARNDDKRKELERLMVDYEKEHGNLDTASSSSSNKNIQDALQTEFQLLKEATTDNLSSMPRTSLLETTNGNQPSESTLETMEMQQYAKDVLNSYHDLRETHQTLEMVLERETKKLAVKKAFVHQQKSILLSLEESQRTTSKGEAGHPAESSTNPSDSNCIEVNIKSENEWIRQQLHSICLKLTASDKTSTEEVSEGVKRKSSALGSSKSKRRRLKSSTESPTSLEMIIQKLLQRLLVDKPDDPYLSVEDLDNYSTRPQALELLKRCGVVQTHPENDKMIRLTDFRR